MCLPETKTLLNVSINVCGDKVSKLYFSISVYFIGINKYLYSSNGIGFQNSEGLIKTVQSLWIKVFCFEYYCCMYKTNTNTSK